MSRCAIVWQCGSIRSHESNTLFAQLIVGGEDQRNPDAGPVAKYLTEGQDISDTPEGADLMERLKLFGTNMREVAVVRLRHGKGSAKTADGLHRVYAGEFVAGLRDGKGIEIGPDGTYDGEWRDNMRKGKGTLRTAYGDVYSGDFGVGDEDKEMVMFFVAILAACLDLSHTLSATLQPGFMEGTMAAEVIARQCKKPLDVRAAAIAHPNPSHTNVVVLLSVENFPRTADLADPQHARARGNQPVQNWASVWTG